MTWQSWRANPRKLLKFRLSRAIVAGDMVSIPPALGGGYVKRIASAKFKVMQDQAHCIGYGGNRPSRKRIQTAIQQVIDHIDQEVRST